jgi:hypothetical protein
MLKFSSQLIYVRTPRSIDPTIISVFDVFVPIVTFPLTTTFLLKVVVTPVKAVVPLVILVTLLCTVLILVTAVATLLCTEFTLALIVFTDVVRLVKLLCTKLIEAAVATEDQNIPLALEVRT